MRTYSSTDLNYLLKYCPKAFRLHMAGVHGDRSVFQVGIAAHAVLEEVGKRQLHDPEQIKRVADDVARILMTEGRDYFGVAEPPMLPDQALAGRDLALAYLETHVLPAGDYEVAAYLPIDQNTMTRALLDLKFEEERGDEDFSGPCLVVTDYKSAWNADDDELETLQRKMQAVLAWSNWGREDLLGLVLEVANLRTGRTHSKLIWMDEEGQHLLANWRIDIMTLCAAADAALDGDRVAPGIGCLSCPFSKGCEECAAAATGPQATVEDMAISYLCQKTRLAGVTAELKVLLRDSAPIAVNGGTVGFQAKTKDEPVADAYSRVLAMWHERQGNVVAIEDVIHKLPTQLTLLMALAPGKTALEKVAKSLYPERTQVAERKEFLRTLVEPVAVAEFGEVKS